jgi:hypothetical protein
MFCVVMPRLTHTESPKTGEELNIFQLKQTYKLHTRPRGVKLTAYKMGNYGYIR